MSPRQTKRRRQYCAIRLPVLSSIASRPGTSTTSVQNFLLTIHLSLANGKDMPNPQLTEDEARDVAAYVMSLRKKKD